MNSFSKNIEILLNNIKNTKIIIKQLGFIESYFEINNFSYTLEYAILKIYNKNSKNFITINLNQIYNIIYTQEKLEFYLDNDTTITIE
jgi:hypothetical protein